MGNSGADEVRWLIEQTERMLDLARTAEWEALAEAEQARQPRLFAIFQASEKQVPGALTKAELETLAKDIQARDQEILVLAHSGMQDVKASLLGLQTGNAANRAYQAVQDLGADR